MPEMFQQFVATTQLLEKHYKDMQDLEFTIERGKLWMLQTRNGKRTGKAALQARGRDVQRRSHHPPRSNCSHRAGDARPTLTPNYRSERKT